jgi:hypothetical protein
MISNQLLISYCETDYRVPTENLTIRLGEHHPALDQLLIKSNAQDWCFITAWNPKSNMLSTVENNELNKQLERDLRNFTYFKGKGESKMNSKWPSEESFLVLGMSLDQVKKIGDKYKQNAVVIGKLKGPAELFVLV